MIDDERVPQSIDELDGILVPVEAYRDFLMVLRRLMKKRMGAKGDAAVGQAIANALSRAKEPLPEGPSNGETGEKPVPEASHQQAQNAHRPSGVDRR